MGCLNIHVSKYLVRWVTSLERILGAKLGKQDQYDILRSTSTSFSDNNPKRL